MNKDALTTKKSEGSDDMRSTGYSRRSRPTQSTIKFIFGNLSGRRVFING